MTHRSLEVDWTVHAINSGTFQELPPSDDTTSIRGGHPLIISNPTVQPQELAILQPSSKRDQDSEISELVRALLSMVVKVKPLLVQSRI